MDVRSLERSGDVAALRAGGELLLIGPWTVFQGVSQSLIIRDPARLRTVLYPHLRDDSSLAKLAALYRRLVCTGSVGGHYSPEQTAEQMVALMRFGQIVAVSLPDTSGQDGHGNVQPAAFTGNPAGPVTQWSLAERFVYVLERVPPHMPPALATELKQALSGTNLAIIVGVLVVWAGSHAVGVGFLADAALLAIGFALAGWAIFDGIKHLVQFFTLTKNASSRAELDQAAREFANGAMTIGVGALIALLTRGATRLAPRPVGRSTPQPAEPTPQTPRQVREAAPQAGAAPQSPQAPRVFHTSDPGVDTLINQIESRAPGTVRQAEINIMRPDGSPYTDFDIVTNTHVIQVKTGGGNGIVKQIQTSQQLTDLPVIGFDANKLAGMNRSFKPSILHSAQQNNITIVDNVDDLMKLIGK
ncbi:hypothetical protein CAL18_17685 [Bordetella genomosp. 7]|uniref:DUF308 domain-containing protein n=1 Tax=Bordetella TaxID=517 RepID=UPI00047C988C|nr:MULTISPECIES: DUF308 domain-containing protein [Bordetella]OZI15805.1 hypothetical protein CAL18_17685 [Bordetella genomosp. 7]